MTTQPEALRLARLIEAGQGDANVVAELRRLHDHTQMLDNAYRAACEVIRQQETVNAELLAALERIADPRNIHFAGDAQVVARAAIARAEGEPK